MKILGILITLLVSLSGSYAADSTNSNTINVSDQIITDSGSSDNTGLTDDANTEDDSGLTDDSDISDNSGLTDNSDISDNSDESDDNGSLSDGTEPVIYYAMDNDGSSTSPIGSVDNSNSLGDSDSQDEDLGNNSTDDTNGTGIGFGMGGNGGSGSGNLQEDPQNSIPMQKTGIPILPAELGIFSIIGGIIINKIKS